MNPELLLAAALVSATSVLFAALGELVSERAGVLNLGVEGTMLVGAVSGFAAAVSTGSILLGFAASFVAGALFGLAFAVLVVSLRLNQVVMGLAFTVLGAGLSAFIGKPFIGVPLRARVLAPDLGPLAHIPFLGPALFRQDLMVYVAFALVIAASVFLVRTRHGLLLRALGENPAVLDALGHPVLALRYVYTVLGAALAGLGGAYISLVLTPSWIENMTAGRGWIAIALVIFAIWRPLWLLAGATIFGLVDALRFRAQVGGEPLIDPYFLAMLPYVATLVVLAIVSGSAMRQRLGAPQSLGRVYDRETR